jgi:cysteine desulfurase family protein
MVDFMTNIGCNPGRGGYSQSLESGRLVYGTRELINTFFNGPGSENVIFTQNITSSLNTVIKGMLKENWHVITSSMEHNSVMRPLRRVEADRNVEITVAQCGIDGTLDPAAIKNSIRDNTKAVVMTHASNLTGTIMPVEEVGKICSEYGLYFIVDTAQSAGVLDIDFKRMNIDVLAFTGHKGLMGPQGIGGFIISDRADKITLPLIEGGTGSRSHLETQPDMLPDKYESGTLNTVGIAGLKAGIDFIQKEGISNIRRHESMLLDLLIQGLKTIPNVLLYGPIDSMRQTSVLSMNIAGMDPAELSYILDSEYGIMTRTGLHCTPSAHKTIGTYPLGTVRLSIGYFNTVEDIQYTVDTIKKLAK